MFIGFLVKFGWAVLAPCRAKVVHRWGVRKGSCGTKLALFCFRPATVAVTDNEMGNFNVAGRQVRTLGEKKGLKQSKLGGRC
jgi:hypothetical protein